MPISYKHKIYTTLGTPTTLSGGIVSVTNSSGVPARNYSILGKSIVWNQILDKSKYPVTTTTNGVTFTNNGDGSITVNGTADAAASAVILVGKNLSVIQGHKYYATMSKTIEHNNFWFGLYDNSEDQPFQRGTVLDRNGRVLDCIKSSGTLACQIALYKNKSVSNAIVKPQLFDLTQMFGAGNEPTTPEEFRAMFPDDYYPYNAGELKTIVPTSVEASGINLLNLVGRKEISSDIVGYRYPTDAYPEIDTHIYYRGISANGYLSSGNVVEATVLSSSVIAKTGTNPGSPGYGVGIPLTVVPSTTYYIKCITSGVISIGYANSNKIITKFTGELSGPNIAITTPEDCRYALIVFRPNALDTLATFENICVSTVQTNEYQPYKKYRANIPSSKYFPDGMRSAGSAYDEINFLSQKAIKRIGAVDMGTLNWGSNPGTYPTNSFYSVDFHDAKGNTRNIISNGKFNRIYANNGGIIIAITDRDEKYDSNAAFKAAMSGVMLYYELATPVETTITPPLQALPTYKGFTSFSAPNSLTQNGPLSVTYYAEGGTNPESGWLTSYKRKLYMGRTIEWNQLLDKSKYPATTTTNGVTFTNNGDGTITVNGTATNRAVFLLYSGSVFTMHGKGFIVGDPKDRNAFINYDLYDSNRTWLADNASYGGKGTIFTMKEGAVSCNVYIAIESGASANNLVFKPQLFDLTQMFGAGNEPATPEEFWSYFDHKLYPYNPGETQPLFKISRKSQWGGASLYDYTFDETTGVLTLNKAPHSQSGDTLTIL